MRFLAHTLACAALSLATTAWAAGTWQDTLQARDIDGDGTVDAYYDASSNLTWLAVINASAGSAPDLIYTYDTVPYRSTASDQAPRSGVAVPYTQLNKQGYLMTYYAYGDGLMSWQSANGWGQGLNVHGVDDWRLPSAADGELAHLIQVTLGNGTVPDTSVDPATGPFSRIGFSIGNLSVKLRESVFWLDEPEAFYNAFQRTSYPGNGAGSELSTWVVRTGDVPSIPEPGTFAMVALGLAGIAWRGSRRAC